MARPADPINIAEAKGSTRKNPKRYTARKAAAEAAGPIGEPPAWFESTCEREKLRAIWYELVSAAPPGKLTSYSREWLGQFSLLVLEARRPGLSTKLRVQAVKAAESGFRKLGMDPSLNAVSATPTTKDNDALSAFVAKKA